MELAQVARPGLILSQVWPGTRCCEGETLRAIEHVLRLDFFRAVHTVDVPTACERRDIAAACAGSHVQLTYCLTRLLTEKGLSLADLDESRRQKAVDGTRRWLDDAREQGAEKLLLVTGSAPADEKERQIGLRQFEESLGAICQEAAGSPRVQVLVEALDVRAHKKCTLGFLEEAIRTVRRVSGLFDNLSLCLDTAHVLLNGEDPAAGILAGADIITDFHFCNCVTDPTAPLYGDWHLPFGPPGAVDVRTVSDLMAVAVRAGVLVPSRRPSIYCEILTRPDDDAFANMEACRRNLEQAWQMACLSTKSHYEDQKENPGASAESLQHRGRSPQKPGRAAVDRRGQRRQ
ncbi:MAG: sugar phosphate isomerase/epimerase family protein [Acidobacteriota bacterium]